MRFGKSSNPALTQKKFNSTSAFDILDGNTMTLNGTVNKTLILFGLLLITAYFSWTYSLSGLINPRVLIIGGAIGGLILAIFTIMKPQKAPITAPIYALVEGVFIGAISAMYSSFYSGIVMQAIGITLSIFLIMLLLYKTGIIKATPKFKKGIIIATLGVMFFYLLNFVARLFGGGVSLFNLGIVGIGISLVIVVIASMNLILDFDMIERNIQKGQPKYIEWFAAFGLMITLVWLYLEILRLLALLSRR